MQHVEKWPNGNLRTQFQTEGGQKHGFHTEWYEGGEKRSELPYVNGQLHGAATAWYPNGLIAESGHFHRGLRTGQWTLWHPNGQRKQVVSHEGGLVHGLSVTWDERGQVISQAYYEKGQISGAGQSTALANPSTVLPGALQAPAAPLPGLAPFAGTAPAMYAPVVNNISIQVGANAQSAASPQATAVSEATASPKHTQVVEAAPGKNAEPAPVDVDALKKEIEAKLASEFRNQHPKLYERLSTFQREVREVGTGRTLFIWFVLPGVLITCLQMGLLPGSAEGQPLALLRSWWISVGIFLLCIYWGNTLLRRDEHACYVGFRDDMLRTVAKSGVTIEDVRVALSKDKSFYRLSRQLSRDRSASDDFLALVKETSPRSDAVAPREDSSL